MDKNKTASRAIRDAAFQARGPLIDLGTYLPFKLAVVAGRVSHLVARSFEREFGLHIPEWRMLVALANHGASSALRVADLTSMDPARVNRAQSRLRELGLIATGDDPEDRRRVILSLTEAGLNVAHQIVQKALSIEKGLFASLDEGDRDRFDRILTHLFEETADRGPGS